jgi:kynurenine 3-monooxygenase
MDRAPTVRESGCVAFFCFQLRHRLLFPLRAGAFEDALVFIETLDAVGGSLSAAVPAFCSLRRPATDALADLSLDNYVEMRHKTATWEFALRKRVDAALTYWFPGYWIPLYSMVSFTRIPYDLVVARAQAQDRIVATATSVGITALAVAGAAALVFAVFSRGRKFQLPFSMTGSSVVLLLSRLFKGQQ